MTNRHVGVVMLTAMAVSAAGTGLALASALAARRGVDIGPGLLPLVVFASFVGVFLPARETVLPSHLARPFARALAVLSVWMAVTLVIAAGLAWAARALLAPLGTGRMTLAIVFTSVLVSVAVLDRFGARTRGRATP